MMKYYYLILLTFVVMEVIAQDIEIMDDRGNSDTYPTEFLKQSEYFKGIIEDAQYQPPLLIPANISLSEMHNFYMDSLTDFKTSSLQQLTEYFLVANSLLNHDLQKQLVQRIDKI